MIYKCSPSIRTASLQDTTGYTWGKTWEESYIKHTLSPDHFFTTPEIIAERWIVSDDPTQGSLVFYNEKYISLSCLLHIFKEKILGITHYEKHGPHLGIVMKILDTNNTPQKGSLSVQVHPAPGHPTLPPKPEVWYGSGSFYVGTKEPYTETELLHFCNEGTLEEHMQCIVSDTRQRIIILGGTLHAIRYGSTLYEWSYSPTRNEQSLGSLQDATIGLYDRTDGKTPRPGKEQPERAMEVMQHAASQGGSMVIDDVRILFQDQHNTHKELFSVEEMVVEELCLTQPYIVKKNEARSIFIESGSMTMQENFEDTKVPYHAGEEGLISYDSSLLTITPTSEKVVMYMYYRK